MKTLFFLLVLSSNLFANNLIFGIKVAVDGKQKVYHYEVCGDGRSWDDCCTEAILPHTKELYEKHLKEFKKLERVCKARFPGDYE